MQTNIIVIKGRYEEGEHPRYPKGSPKGGKWKPKGGTDYTQVDAIKVFSSLEDSSRHEEAREAFKQGALEDLEWIFETFGDVDYDSDGFEEQEDVAFSNLQGAIEEKLTDLVKGSKVRVMRPLNSLKSLIEYGKLSTLHTAPDDVRDKIESGWTDTWLREEFERDGLGVDPRTTPITDRPVYGAIRREDVNASGNRQYGNVEYILKQDVNKRTFITAGDSLVGYSFDMEPSPRMMPSPMLEPGWYSVEYKNVKNLLNTNSPDEFKETFLNMPSETYIEAQVVGGVRLEDIEKIIIYDDVTPSNIIKWFRSHGIDIEERNSWRK